MRFWATMRRPFSSNRALILPVRFRRVASGLMIEKVRSTAMKSLFDAVLWRVGGAYRRGVGWLQGGHSTLFVPIACALIRRAMLDITDPSFPHGQRVLFDRADAASSHSSKVSPV